MVVDDDVVFVVVIVVVVVVVVIVAVAVAVVEISSEPEFALLLDRRSAASHKLTTQPAFGIRSLQPAHPKRRVRIINTIRPDKAA